MSATALAAASPSTAGVVETARKAPGRRQRIGFLFNHDQIHQIAHSLPIAIALSHLEGSFEVIVAVTNPLLRREVLRMAGSEMSRLTLVDLKLNSTVSQALSRSLGAILPADKILVYRDNLDFFRSLDILVVSERTSLLLKSRYGLERPLMVLADHGAGDRAIAFTQKVAMFDHVLAAGPKLRDRFIKDAGVPASKITIVGYPKFDTIPPTEPHLPMQLNGRPTVIYNPHVSPHLSSWYQLGSRVLDYFYSSQRYNLIFAPHIMLFQRRIAVTIDKLRVARTGSVARKYRDAPHIHVDCGSLSSTDMSYVRAADIYLGDCSSQVYEFLKTPRPCVFLNAQDHHWLDNPNFGHWSAGPVIRSAQELDLALEFAVSHHEARYRRIQHEMFAHTFNLSVEPSSVRAANVIRDLASETAERRSL